MSESGLGTVKLYLEAEDPKAKPYWEEVELRFGYITLWEMRGPKREDGSSRTMESLIEGNSTVDIAWIAWTALKRPSGSFEDFLLRIINIDMESADDDEEDVPTDPKVPSGSSPASSTPQD